MEAVGDGCHASHALNAVCEFEFAHASILDHRSASSTPHGRMYSALRAACAPSFPPALRTVSAVFFTAARTLRLRRPYASMAAHATVNTTARLQALRELMAKPEYDVQAVVVPTEDQRKYSRCG